MTKFFLKFHLSYLIYEHKDRFSFLISNLVKKLQIYYINIHNVIGAVSVINKLAMLKL